MSGYRYTLTVALTEKLDMNQRSELAAAMTEGLCDWLDSGRFDGDMVDEIEFVNGPELLP